MHVIYSFILYFFCLNKSVNLTKFSAINDAFNSNREYDYFKKTIVYHHNFEFMSFIFKAISSENITISTNAKEVYKTYYLSTELIQQLLKNIEFNILFSDLK